MDVSIILSTWNNSKRLDITLSELKKCTLPKGLNWEIIVVNNNCTDHTDDIVAKYTNDLPVVYVKEPKQGLSRARNKGIKTAKGELLIFTDDDVRPSVKWISLYWEYYSQHKKGHFFGGSVESEFEDKAPHRSLLKFSPPSVKGINFGDQSKILKDESSFVAANWACRKDDIEKVGSFDVEMGLGAVAGEVRTGEETDAINKLKHSGLSPFYVAGASIKHFVPKDKTSEDHILIRREAYGFEVAKYEHQKNFNIFSYVFKMIVSFIKCLLLKLFCVIKSTIGQKIYTEKIEISFQKGYVSGLKHSLNNKR